MASKKHNRNIFIAKTLLKLIGGEPKIIRFNNNDPRFGVDVFVGRDHPYNNITSYSTIGLSNYSIEITTANKKELRVEFIGACNNEYNLFPNILSSVAFNIINDKATCKQGIVFTDIIEQYYSNDDTTMKHIMFVDPFLWKNIQSIEFDDMIVTWLMAIPISQSEFEFHTQHGSDALEKLFAENAVDICDLKRVAVV